jgi:hypothetical protein
VEATLVLLGGAGLLGAWLSLGWKNVSG